MVGEIDERRSVGLCLIGYRQRLFAQRIGHPYIQITGIVFFTVCGTIIEHNMPIIVLLHGPCLLVKTMHTAVKRVCAVIDRQLVLLAIQRKTTVLDAVSAATDDGIEIGLFRAPFLFGSETQDDISPFAVLVRHDELGELGSVVRHLRAQACVP